MPKLRFNITMSLDGYVAGPGQSVENPLGEGGMVLHGWAFATRSPRAVHGMDGGGTYRSAAVAHYTYIRRDRVAVMNTHAVGSPGDLPTRSAGSCASQMPRLPPTPLMGVSSINPRTKLSVATTGGPPVTIEEHLMRKQKSIAAIIASAAVFGVAACGGSEGNRTGSSGAPAATSTPVADTSNRGLPQGSEPSSLDPKDFSTTIDNPYWPMTPGSRWVYSETNTDGARQKVVITVTPELKRVANGVTARVIRDVVTENGTPVEITDDWYAQDKAGNIWYLGEAVRNFENGKLVDRAGSFEAGVDGAQPGIAMPANPVPGLSYRQEYYAGKAEDKAAVITVGQEQVEVPFGHFADGVLMTRDLVPTEPKVQELKFYAPGVGPLLSVHLDGAGGRAELLSYTPGK